MDIKKYVLELKEKYNKLKNLTKKDIKISDVSINYICNEFYEFCFLTRYSHSDNKFKWFSLSPELKREFEKEVKTFNTDELDNVIKLIRNELI